MGVMRWPLLVIIVASGLASADKRVNDMTPGYKRELGACEIEQGGVQRMIDKAKRYVAAEPADKVDIEKDIERLAKGLEVVTGYCKEVGAMVQVLESNAATPYKKIEKEIDDHYRAVFNARKVAKAELEELAPITRKLIPIVNAKVQRPDEKKQTAKFPSGRVVELPDVTGSWKLGGNATTDTAEIAVTGASASVTSQPFQKASCEQQRKSILAKVEDATELELPAAAKAIDVAWAVRYVRRDKTPHAVTTMCMEDGMNGFLVVADVTPATQKTLADGMTKLMVSMLSSRRGPRTSSPG
jgi:hypothetical protein